ncbi:MAG TPA: MBL fold metallo-hydrolase [Pyrinomonadaceae bacterium]|nr:MBL fold metallo-hydrolase [Pyrinomonadaceae bacterium]
MKLVVLGSGTSVPHPERSSSAFWLETKAGSVLLDVGASAVHRMAQENLAWAELNAIWVSHFHLDHVGGLAPFLFGTKYAPQTQARRKPLAIFGPRGMDKLLRTFDRTGKYELLEQPFSLEVREVAPLSEFEMLPGLRARTLSTPHTRESVALRLTEEHDGTSLVYTSDTGYIEALASFARDVDLLMIECSFRRTSPVKTHLVLEEAINLACLSGTRRALLTHLYPEWDGVDLAAEAKKLWNGETIEARDGLRLEIS